jgi:hypothetical protein
VRFAARGLGSLPGGDDSALVSGVSASVLEAVPLCEFAGRLLLEKTDDAALESELAEPTVVFSRSPGDTR